jgi:hypothetical protein
MRNVSDGQSTRLYRQNLKYIRFRTNSSSAGRAACLRHSESDQWINNASTEEDHDVLPKLKRIVS